MALIVKRSQLPKSGKGLYTTKTIKKNGKVIQYKGEIIDWKAYEKRVAEDRDGYLFFVSRNHCIDAYPTRQYKARFANDAAGISRKKGLRNNCTYQIFENKCFIVAERNIQPGEEIFVDYTRQYWECIRYNLRNRLYKRRKPL